MTKSTFLFALIFSVLGHPSKAQSIIGSVTAKGDDVIESLTKGDSVLLAIRPDNTIAVTDQKHTSYQSREPLVSSDLYWISESGVSQPLSILRSSDDNLIGFDASRNGHLYAYFSGESKKEEILKIYTGEEWKFSKEPISLLLPGSFISSYQDTCLNIVTLEKKTSTLTILRIKESRIVNEKNIKIPFRLGGFKTDEIEFINPKAHVRLDQSFAKVKFFLNDNIISMVLDEPMLPHDENQNPPFKTTLFSYDLVTDKSDIKLFFEFTKGWFRSYVCDRFLFKVTDASDGDRLVVFDINSQKQLIDMEVLPKEAYKTTEGFERNGRDFKIKRDLLKSLSVPIGYSDQWSPVILVEKFENDYIVTVGNFSNYKGKGFVSNAVSASFGLLTYALITAARQSREKPANSAYTYLSGNPMNNFYFKKDLTYYKKNIDDFEVSSTNNFKFKGYISTQTWSAGLYMFEGSTKLSIVKFPR